MHPTQTFDLCLRDHQQRLADLQDAREHDRRRAERTQPRPDARAHPPEPRRVLPALGLSTLAGAAR